MKIILTPSSDDESYAIGNLGDLEISLEFDEGCQQSGYPPLYFVRIVFDEPVETHCNAGDPTNECVEKDVIRRFPLCDLANDGAPVGVVGGLPARAERLESGRWLLTLWAGSVEEAVAHVLNNCIGAV